MAAPINVLVFTRRLYHREHLVASKSTGSSLYMLPQYTVALRVSRNYSKVAYLKWLKFRIVLLSFFFSSQPNTLTQEVTQIKWPSFVRKFPKDSSFVLSLKRNYSLHWASSKDLYCNVLPCWTPFSRTCYRPHNDAMVKLWIHGWG